MIEGSTQQLVALNSLAKDFFLARQPILNRDQVLVAHELLFRRAAAGPAGVVDNLSATAEVIAHASALGLEIVIGDSLGFINIDAEVLLSDVVTFLPHQKVILEILEFVEATPEVIERMAELVKAGFRFALDDVAEDSENIQKFLPLIEIVKIDIKLVGRDKLASLSSLFKAAGKKILAEKVESVEEFQHCVELGFDYFQGYYFAQPVILTGKKIAPSELAVINLMDLIRRDADHAEIERSIKQDASIALNLLRMVNTPASGAHQRIGSLSQALLMLGRNHLQRWLQILLYARTGKENFFPSPLLVLATTRGKLIELIAQRVEPGNRGVADIGFTVGIMSLMDTLFGLPMEKILEQIAVIDEVSNALLERKGIYGEMLKLAEYVERIDETSPLLLQTLEKLQLAIEDLYSLQLAAFEWVDTISYGESE